MNEWEFSALAATWMSNACQADSSLPFSEARVEQKGKGSRKRRDITLLDRDGHALLTGEVKMPYQPEGGSPLRYSVVRDAREKAKRAGVAYFFTWNVNRMVLWPTDPGEEQSDAFYREWEIIDLHRENQLQLRQNQEVIQRWIPDFLREFADILRGNKVIDRKPPDLRFIQSIEAELEQPILQTTDALAERYKRAATRSEIQKWMREEQGWTIADTSDRDGVLEDLNRAAHFANYALLNKIVFHEALMKRFGTELSALDVPKHVDTADALRSHLEGHFAVTRKVTGDYETVFGDSSMSFGNRIPFFADPAVAYWRMLIEQVHQFDFSKLDYEIIGNIFERLISPEERHKYGQYYTRAEVVDLINAFCIRSGKEKVMDPACGGGTFLVRAYVRKRELNPEQNHSERLRDLFGVDVSHFATHLTTINLATRDLIDDENYPQVARSDFFDIDPGSILINLPRRITAGGLGSKQTREVDIPLLDAIVGNPPYVRQEGIPKSPNGKKNGPKPGTKEFYKYTAEKNAGGLTLSGRSDLHVYFWLHAAQFLHHGGRLGLLTSSQWLDVDYGFRLQEFILRHFEIEAIFESLDEPWFVGARVATVATLLRRQPNEADRMNNIVRFVQLRQKMEEILEHDGTAAGAVDAANRFRDHILSLESNTVTDRYRARLVHQGDLWNAGVSLGKTLGKSKHGPAKDPQRQQGDYYGGKWGTHVRAPDIWFEVMDRFGEKFKPLGEIANVRFGVKSGKDAFFFPIDASAEVLEDFPDAKEFKKQFGVVRKDVEQDKIKIVKCGEGRGEYRPLESELLEPEIHSLMEIDGFTVTSDQCRRMILLTGMRSSQLPKHAKKYIDWGEANGWHEASTCASRASKDREWHDLTGHKRGQLFWPMQQQYKHAIPTNDNDLICNHNLFDVYVPKNYINVFGGILNSTITVVAKFQYGRPVGVEGNLKTEVVDTNMMLVPDPRQASSADRKRVADAFKAMKDRKARAFVSEKRLRRMSYIEKGREDELRDLDDRTELDMPDRWKLDNAVLRMIGVEDKEERQKLLEKLYAHIREHFEWTRQKEEKAIRNKKQAKKRAPSGPSAIAAEIIEQLKEEFPSVLQTWDRNFFDARAYAFDTYEVPLDGQPELLNDLVHQNTLRFTKGNRKYGDVETRTEEQAALLMALAQAGIRGFVRVPLDRKVAAELHGKFAKWWQQRMQTIQELIQQRTSDEELQERTLAALLPLVPAA